MIMRWLLVVLGLTLLSGCAPLFVSGAAGTIAVAHDRRTVGTVIEDQSIELKAYSLLKEDTAPSARANIRVISFNQIVLLVGQAPNAEVKNFASEQVSNIAKVRRVYNEISLDANKSFGDRSGDTLLSSKIKAKYIAEKDFDPTRIKVVSELDTVYLMGLVTDMEAKKAIAIARRTKGVKRVVPLFEYIPPTN